jgi:hypothetical protein
MGSIINFREISKEDITNYGIHPNQLVELQNLLIKDYSTSLINKECSLEMLRDMKEPILDVISLDLIESLFKNGELSEEVKMFPNLDKIMELIQLISNESYYL